MAAALSEPLLQSSNRTPVIDRLGGQECETHKDRAALASGYQSCLTRSRRQEAAVRPTELLCFSAWGWRSTATVCTEETGSKQMTAGKTIRLSRDKRIDVPNEPTEMQ